MPVPLIPIAMAAASLIGSAIKKKKANAAMPPAVDAQQAGREAEARLMLQSLRAGNDPTTQAGFREAQNVAATTQGNAVRLGGSPSFALDALRMSQRGAGENVNRVLGNLTPMVMQQQQFANGLGDAISQRRLELSLLQRARMDASAAQLGKEGFSNLAGAFAMPNAEGGNAMSGLDGMISKLFSRGREAAPDVQPMQPNQPTFQQPALPARTPNQGPQYPDMSQVNQVMKYW